MKENQYIGTCMLALLLVTVSAYATDMQPLICDEGQTTKVAAPSKISGQAFDLSCTSSNPGEITFIYNVPGSQRGLTVSIVNAGFMANIIVEQMINDSVVNAKKTNIKKLPQPNAVGKNANNILKSVFVADKAIVEIHDERLNSSEETLVAFSSDFAKQVGAIISSWNP